MGGDGVLNLGGFIWDKGETFSTEDDSIISP